MLNCLKNIGRTSDSGGEQTKAADSLSRHENEKDLFCVANCDCRGKSENTKEENVPVKL